MNDDMVERATAWLAEVDAAYADGGYAAGDGPEPPVDEMYWLLEQRRVLRYLLAESRWWAAKVRREQDEHAEDEWRFPWESETTTGSGRDAT